MGLFSAMRDALQGAFNRGRAKEELRSEALLGPTNENAAGSFTPIERDADPSVGRPDDVTGPTDEVKGNS